MPSFPTIMLSISLCLAAACGRADQATATGAGAVTPAPIAEEIVDYRQAAPIVEEPFQPPPPPIEASLGSFDMTYYWVALQKKAGKEPLYDKKCNRIARVSKSFKRRLTIEGSGHLKDGRTISKAGGCACDGPCYWIPDETHKWGAGVASRPLAPFRSIAVDPEHIKIGTSLYVAELDGLTMPGSGSEGGFVHDGCVIADDRGGGVRGKQIDFFAGRRAHYENLFSRHKITKVSVFLGGARCQERQNEPVHTANAGSS